MIEKYENSYIENNAILVNRILKSHPELEEELMESYKNNTNDIDPTFLQKYGFLEEDSLKNLSFVTNLEHEVQIVIYITFFSLFFLFFFIAFFFYHQKEKRIREINHYLFHVLENKYEVNLKDYREDNLSRLKSDLLKVTNKLRNTTEISLKDKKNLERTLSDISHQLRTPLTSLNVIHDALQNDNLPKEKRLAFLSQQKEQLQRMEWLVVTLLKMSQIDSGTIVFQRKKENVLSLVLEAMKPILIPMELKQITYTLSIDEKISCNLDYHWTVEALVNIFKNAIEHTNQLGHIKVIATDNPMYVEIIVEDNGVGIKKEDLPHIFERFYKGKAKNDSVGIGLNLTKTIIEKQDGTIHVESKIEKGTRFIIHFYKMTI